MLSEVDAQARLCFKDVNNVFSSQFHFLGLQETWITVLF